MSETNSIASSLIESYRNQTYDATLQSFLLPISTRHQIVFSASCAQRLIPYCTDFFNQNPQLRQIDTQSAMSRIWLHLQGQLMSDSEVATSLESLKAVSFGELDLIGRNASILALDSVYLTFLACRDATPIGHVLQVAQRAETIIYQYLLEQILGRNYVFHGSQHVNEVHSQISANPLMIAELTFQSDTISILSKIPALSSRDIDGIRHLCDTFQPVSFFVR